MVRDKIFKGSLKIKKESRVLAFLKTVLQSFYPDSYQKLSEKSLRQGMVYFLQIVMLSLAILVVLIIANIASFQLAVNNELAKVDSLNITGSVNLSEPILFEKQGIVIANDMNYTDENLLITNSEIIRKPFLCTLLKPACLFTGEPVRKNISDFSSLGQDKAQIGSIFKIILLLMAPSLLFIYFVYFFLKTVMIILLLSVIGAIAARVLNYNLPFKKALLIAIFSSTIMVLAEPFNLVMWNLFYIHVILFLLLFIINISLVSERRHDF